MFQETLKENFPSWEDVQRYREVVVFVAGLMKDPRPLVQYLYEMQIEVYLNEMRTDGITSIDNNLLKSLHAESTVKVFDDPLHNKYINYYNHWWDDYMNRPRDKTNIYYPSKLYFFQSICHKVVLENHAKTATEIPPCAVFIYDPDETVMDSLLSTCSEIFKHQEVTDLLMEHVTCNSLEAPRLINPVTVHLDGCKLPDDFMEKFLHDLKGCGESLQLLKLDMMNLEPFESLLDELLEDLVAHHQRKREAGLAQRKLELWLTGDEDEEEDPTNLSDEFMEKWRNRCDVVESIDCTITYNPSECYSCVSAYFDQ